jgi:integrase
MSELLLPPQQRTNRLAPLPPADPSVPYTPAEQAALRSWADGQTTPYKSVNCHVLLALGLGAGLSAAEACEVRAGHVHIDADGVLIDIPGKRAGQVPVLAVWEPALITVARAALRPTLYLFRPGRAASTRNQVCNFVYTTNVGWVRPNLIRMRATWMVTHLAAGTPVKAVVQAAGVDSLEALTCYLRYVPDVDPATYRASLRAAFRAVEGGFPVTAGTTDVVMALADLLCLPVVGKPMESRRGYLSDRVVSGAAALIDDSGNVDQWHE